MDRKYSDGKMSHDLEFRMRMTEGVSEEAQVGQYQVQMTNLVGVQCIS